MAVITNSEIQFLRQLLERLESNKEPVRKPKATNKELEKKYSVIFQNSESKKKK
jgi:hypothetical protein